MSKKDKKRIAELERKESILAAKVRVMQYYIGPLYAAKEQLAAFQSGTISSEPKQPETAKDSPKQEPTFQSLLDEYHAELSDKIVSEINKTIEFWAGVFGLRASKQDEPKQPEINHYDPAKATLNKMVSFHIREIQIWLSFREHSTTEIAQAIQICVDNLGLDLADFRRKVLDLGRVKPSKVDLRNSEMGEVEPKGVEWPKEKQQEADQTWAVYNSETNLWLRRVWNDAYWQPAYLQYSGFGSKEIAEGNIKWLHENGTLRARIEHCKAVLVAPKKSEQPEENQSQTNQPSPEKDSEKRGEADGADSPTRAGYYYIVIVNHKQGGAPLYLLDFEQTACDGVPDMTILTTSIKEYAHKFEHIKPAQNFIDLAIERGANKDYNFFIDTVQ